MEIVLNRKLISGYAKKFEFVESEGPKDEEEPGLKEFLRQQLVSGDATEEEIRFLRGLKFSGKHPTALYYYRELQNLRDPLHFCEGTTRRRRPKTPGQSQPDGAVAPMHKYSEADGIEKQLQLDGRKRAIRRWAVRRGSPAKK